MLLLAEPFLLACSLPSLSRQPVIFAPLRGQALLQRREAPTPTMTPLVCRACVRAPTATQ